jgi:hypothetical protein
MTYADTAYLTAQIIAVRVARPQLVSTLNHVTLRANGVFLFRPFVLRPAIDNARVAPSCSRDVAAFV